MQKILLAGLLICSGLAIALSARAEDLSTSDRRIIYKRACAAFSSKKYTFNEISDSIQAMVDRNIPKPDYLPERSKYDPNVLANSKLDSNRQIQVINVTEKIILGAIDKCAR